MINQYAFKTPRFLIHLWPLTPCQCWESDPLSENQCQKLNILRCRKIRNDLWLLTHFQCKESGPLFFVAESTDEANQFFQTYYFLSKSNVCSVESNTFNLHNYHLASIKRPPLRDQLKLWLTTHMFRFSSKTSQKLKFVCGILCPVDFHILARPKELTCLCFALF